jgi:hypothetical protein
MYRILGGSIPSHVSQVSSLLGRLLIVATADADPLGVDMNVTFDNVGGLDNRKLPIKIMVLQC